jgi:hypothetical protein
VLMGFQNTMTSSTPKRKRKRKREDDGQTVQGTDYESAGWRCTALPPALIPPHPPINR